MTVKALQDGGDAGDARELTGDAWAQRVSAWSFLAITIGQLVSLGRAMKAAGPVRTAEVMEEIRRELGLESQK